MARDREVLITVRVGSIDYGNLKSDLAELEKNVIKIPIEGDIKTGKITTDINKALSSIKAGDLNKDIRLEINNASWKKDLDRAESAASKTAKEINEDFDRALKNAGSSTTLRNRLMGEDGLSPTTDELDIFIRDYTNALDKLASVQFDTSNITAGFDESDLYNYAEALQEVCNYLEVMNESQIDFTKYGIEDATWDLEDYNQQLQELRTSAPEIVNEIGTQNIEQINTQMEKMYEAIIKTIGSMDGFSLNQLTEGLDTQVKAAEEEIKNLKAELDEAQEDLSDESRWGGSTGENSGLVNYYRHIVTNLEYSLDEAEDKLKEFSKAGFDTGSAKDIANQLTQFSGITGDIDNAAESFKGLKEAMSLTEDEANGGIGFDAITDKFKALQSQLESTQIQLRSWINSYTDLLNEGYGTGNDNGEVAWEDYYAKIEEADQAQKELLKLQQQWQKLNDIGVDETNINEAVSILGQFTGVSEEVDNITKSFTGLNDAMSGTSGGAQGVEQYQTIIEDLKNQIQVLEDEVNKMQDALDRSVDIDNAVPTEQYTEAQNQIQAYKEQIESLKDTIADLQNSNNYWSTEAIDNSIANGELEKQLADIKTQYAELSNLVDEYKDKIKELTSAQNGEEVTQGFQIDVDQFQQLLDLIQQISDALASLQSAFGTIGEGGEFQPYLAQIQDMVSGINELKETMSGLDFNFQINMGGNKNPIQQNAEYGQAARQSIEELKQAYEELESVLSEGIHITSANNTKNGVAWPNYGVNTEAAKEVGRIRKEWYSAGNIAGDSNSSLQKQIEGYQTLIDCLKELASLEGKDISSWEEQFGNSAEKSVEDAEKIKSGAKQTEESMNQLKSLFGGTNNVDFSGMVDQLQQILEVIQQISDKLGEGFDFSKLFGEGDASISTLLEPLQRIPDMLDQINQQLSGGLKFGAEEDTSSIDNFIASMERIPDTLDKVNAKLNGGLKVNNVSDKAFASFEKSMESLSSSSESLGDKVDDVELYADALRTLSSIDLSGLASNLKDVGNVKGINQVTKTMQQQSNQFQKEQESRINASIKSYMKAGGNESDSAVQDARALLEVLDTEFSTLGLSGKSSIEEITSSMGEFSKQTQDVISNLNQMTAELNRKGTTEQQTANLEKQYSSALTTLEKLENKLVSGKDLTVRESSQLEQARAQIEEINQMTDEVGQQVADKFSDQFNQITQNYQTSIGELLDTSISEATASLDTSVEGLGSFNEIKTDLNELTELKQHFLELKPGEVFSDEDVKRTNELRSAVKELSNDLTPITNRQGTYQGVLSSTDVSGRVNELKEYIKAQNEASDATVEFNKVTKDGSGLSYTITDKSAGTVQQWTASIDQATGSFRTYMNTESQYITVSDRMMASLKSKMTTLTSYLTVMMSFQRVFSIIKDGMNTIKEIDSAMKQLEIVTGASNDELTQFLENSIDLSKELGQDVSEVVDTITVFSRLGYNLEDASELAEYSAILSNVADVEISDATTGLTSAIKGFDLAVEDSEHVADVLITVGQNYAVSASEILEAFEKSSAAMAATDTSFEQAAAIIAAGNAAVQDASTVGTALKTKLYCLCVQKCAYRTYLIAGNA